MTDSNFEKIKKLMKIIGGKVILVEDGKPTMVLINVDEYARVSDIQDEFSKRNEADGNLEKINLDINVWKKKQEERRLRNLESNLNLKGARAVFNEKVDDGIVVEGL